jgi:succinylglutamate desuccinylase
MRDYEPRAPTSRSSVMPDYFALLNQPRRPWLDPEAIQSKFRELLASVHPDRVHQATETERRSAQEQSTLLNAAYQCLHDDKARLGHLLELERGGKPAQLQNVPDQLMNWSLEVSGLCRDADALIVRKAAIASPLLKVSLFQESQAAAEQLLAQQRRVASGREQLLARLKQLDQEWMELTLGSTGRDHVLARLEELYRLLAFFNRWADQLQERLVQLSF